MSIMPIKAHLVYNIRVKTSYSRYYYFIFAFLLALIIAGSFYLGMTYSKQQKGSQIVFSCGDSVLAAAKIPLESKISKGNTQDFLSNNTQGEETGAFLGSKNGTKYYTPDCAGAKRIKSENRVWFTNEEEARMQGYTAASC